MPEVGDDGPGGQALCFPSVRELTAGDLGITRGGENKEGGLLRLYPLGILASYTCP